MRAALLLLIASLAHSQEIPPELEVLAAKTFNVSARQFTYDFSPAPFVVNQGDTVTINLTAADNGTGEGHGMLIEHYSPTFNFVKTGETLTIQFTADVSGSFSFFCTRVCGEGHPGMGGVFTVIAAEQQPPVIASFEPSSGPVSGGTVVTINGSRFQTGATVHFGSTPASSVFVSGPSQIFATAPAQAAGEVAIRVTNPDGLSVTSTQRFRYEPAAPAVAITSISPNSGSTAGGTELTIRGAGFTDGTTVTIGDRSAVNVTVVSASVLVATTPLGPANISGALTRDVVVRIPDGTSSRLANGFTWLLPAPSITSMAPLGGPAAGGTLVTIKGAGFSTATGLTVSFGGVPATNVQVIDAITLTAVTPAHAAGNVDVVISGTNGSVTVAEAFSFAGTSSRRRAVRH